MEKIYCQINSNNFFIGLTANNWACAIDTMEPVYDNKTHKAKWDEESSTWIIKTNEEWENETLK